MSEKHRVEDYLDSIGAKVPEKRGGWCKMRCPFHPDSHASAAINFDENRFKCFACPAQGDIYDLIMQQQGGTYHEALKFAETVSTKGYTTVRGKHSFSRRVPAESWSFRRRE